jgi:Zn-dependent protease with chaperone function
MDAITTARELLPAWAPWANALLYLPAAFLISLIALWAGATLALRPLRKAGPTDWVERARLSYPARRGSLRAALVLAVLFGVLAFAHAGPVNRVRGGPFLVLAGLASYAGSLLVLYRVARRVRPSPWTAGAWLRGQLVLLLVFSPHFLVLLALIALMPDTFIAWVVTLLALGAVALVWLARGGGLSLAAAARLARRPSPRLAAAVEQAVARVGARPGKVYELRARYANALVFPLSGRLAFTEGLLARLDDDEVTAVCAHELAHLTEPRRVAYYRLAPLTLTLVLPLALLITTPQGLIVFEVAVLAGGLLTVLGVRLSRRLERRADELGRAHEGEPGTYARALARIYEVNLVPPVTAGLGATHPHLYDRLVAACDAPAYERPKRPPRAPFFVALAVSSLVALAGCAALEAGRYLLHADEAGYGWSLALYGGRADALAGLAGARFQRDDKEGAVVLYRAAAGSDQRSARHPANLAIVLARLGRCDEAEAAAREALTRLKPPGVSRDDAEAVVKARAAVTWCRLRWPEPEPQP